MLAQFTHGAGRGAAVVAPTGGQWEIERRITPDEIRGEERKAVHGRIEGSVAAGSVGDRRVDGAQLHRH